MITKLVKLTHQHGITISDVAFHACKSAFHLVVRLLLTQKLNLLNLVLCVGSAFSSTFCGDTCSNSLNYIVGRKFCLFTVIVARSFNFCHSFVAAIGFQFLLYISTVVQQFQSYD